MSDLPSRDAAGQAVAFAYRNLQGSGDEVADLVALGIHWSSGRLVDSEANTEHIYYCTTHEARQLDNPALVDRCRAWVVMEHNSREAAAPCLFVDAAIGDTE